MDTLIKGFWLGIVLAAMAVSQGCGQAPAPAAVPAPSITHTGPKQVYVTVFNSGTQDSSLGTKYVFTEHVTTTVPTVVLRTAGTTDQDGTAVGVDFGPNYGQCFYMGYTALPSVFVLGSCSGGLVAGTALDMPVGATVTVWSYVHVCSSDSVVELLLTGEVGE